MTVSVLLGCPSYLKRTPRKSSALRRIPQARYIYISERETSVNGGGCFCCIHRRGKTHRVLNFYQILTTLLASIYVFNIVYPKNWLKTFTFIQNVLVGLKNQLGQVSLDKRILGVLASLNALIPSSTH